MSSSHVCKHERTVFHSIQRLGPLPPLELRQCLDCHSTVSTPLSPEVRAGNAGVAASH
jgi:hypothetical protein